MEVDGILLVYKSHRNYLVPASVTRSGPTPTTRVGSIRFTTLACLTGLGLLTAPAAAADRLSVHSLIRKASVVAEITVESVRDVDAGAVRVHQVKLDQQWKPSLPPGTEPPASIEVVSVVDEPGAAIAEVGDRGIAFLRPLSRNSYLDGVLTPGKRFSFVAGRSGWLKAQNTTDLAAIAKPIELVVTSSSRPETQPIVRSIKERELMFALLAAPSPQLIDDGADTLAKRQDLAGQLSDEEIAILERDLTNPSLPLATRRHLVQAVGEARLSALGNALRSIDDPALQEDAWQALRAIGDEVDGDDLRALVADTKSPLRIPAARELLATGGTGGINAVGPLVEDPDTEVRMAVIEGLGETKEPEAVPWLERSFASEDVETCQASARAMIEIGGDRTADALHRLAFTGPVISQRYAVVTLLAIGYDRDDPRLRDIAKRHKDEKIHQMLEHGIELGHSH